MPGSDMSFSTFWAPMSKGIVRSNGSRPRPCRCCETSDWVSIIPMEQDWGGQR